MISLAGKLTAKANHPTKRVNKAEELTYLSTDIHLISHGYLFNSGLPLYSH
jgi:hypothetical protein